MNNKWTWVILTSILILAAYLRIDFLRSVYHTNSHDTIYYDKMVRQWIEDGVYAYKDTNPNAKVTPGYPLIMAAVYKIVDYTKTDPFPYLRYLNFLLSMANIVLVFYIGRRWVGQAVGLLAAFICAIYPAFIWANGAVLTEVPATFMLTSYLIVQMIAFESRKKTHALLAGILLGLTALIRPEFLPLSVPLYIFYWLQTKNKNILIPFMATLIGITVVMSPWWVRNLVTLDRLILTSVATNPFTAGTYPYKNYQDGLVDKKGKTEKQVGIERLKKGFTEHTWLFVKWYTIGKLEYMYGKMYLGGGHKPRYQVMPHPNQFQLSIIFLGLWGMLLSLRRWRRPLNILTIVIIVISGVHLMFIPEYRYNFTVMPLFILFCSIAMVSFVTWILQRLPMAKKEPLNNDHPPA